MVGGLAKATTRGSKMGKEAVGEIVGILFMSRTYAHMAHLKTGSFAKHKALNKFYDAVVDLADTLAEAGQGEWGKLDVPYVAMSSDVGDPISGIGEQWQMIEEAAGGCDKPYIENILQEIEALYKKTLYLLKELN